MTPYLDDGDVQLYHGDVIQTLRALPAGIAQTCVTSPPYWGLRSYLPDGHDDKATELGLEATPTLYVERMVAVFREVWRVLRDDGTCWINIGDSYLSGQGDRQTAAGELPSTSRFDRPDPKPRPDLPNAPSGWAERAVTRRTYLGADSGLKPKDLAGIPWMLAFALRADGWYLRSDIIWAKPNPMPESVTDRPTKAHEYLFLLAKQPRYYWDADAIREEGSGLNGGGFSRSYAEAQPSHGAMRLDRPDVAGRNRRSVWTIPTEPFPEAHFATYPQALVRPCILAGTSEHGECSACGAPWQREVERKFYGNLRTADNKDGHADAERGITRNEFGGQKRYAEYQAPETTGWRASCACDAATRPQTVLDPFIGSGTTALVARNHARRCIGIDLSAEYLAIAARRLQQLSLLGGMT